MTDSIGSKRLVVGAHYGLRDWLAQRITASLMALFTLLVLLQLIFSRGPIGYDTWAGIFNPQWMRALTFTVILALTYHVWWACAIFGWITSSPSAYAWVCKFSPWFGCCLAWVGQFRFFGDFD